tara:strand:+ start:196 stop:678 length:483 start_codon:yes stop_codon:yes gene_type:complete
MGDHYIFTFFDSQKALWAADPVDPIMVKEIAKMNVKRTVKEQDHWAVVRALPTNGDIGYFWNITVIAENANRYLSTLDKLVPAMKANGHDVSMNVFVADTGRRAGQFMVSMGSPDRAALGALLDDRTQPWFAEVMSDLEGTREIVLGQALRCESYYSAPQ